MLENYVRDEHGIIKQVETNPISYTKDYIEYSYVKYGEITNYMSYPRLGIIGSLGKILESILDIGYGNGSS